MIKKTITYENFDGEMVTEDFYFNMTRTEFMELELSAKPSFSETLKGIVEAKDMAAALAGYKKIVLWAFGERQGNLFIKDEVKAKAFAASEAYSELLLELCQSETAGAEFINAIAPKAVVKQAIQSVQDVALPDEEKGDDTPAWIKEDREPTDAELMGMPRDQLIEAMKRKNAAAKQ